MFVGLGERSVLFGFLLDLLSLLFILLLLGLVIDAHFLSGIGFGVQDREEILAEFQAVILDAGGLVMRPCVVGSGLVHDRAGVGAVRCDGHDGERHRE